MFFYKFINIFENHEAHVSDSMTEESKVITFQADPS